LVALIATLALTACGTASISVVVELEGEDGGDARRLEDIVVRFLPYDRDRVFDSLTQAAPTPEPQIPAELLAARDDIAEAQRAWSAASTREAELRDTISKLNEKLATLNPAMNDYKELFRQVDPMFTQHEGLESQVQSLFETYDDLQQANLERMDAVRIEKENWEIQAFGDIGDVIAARIDASRLEEAADTTGAQGSALVEVAPGQYWVYARYELLYDELYWNVPVTVERGDPVVVRLTRANAERRPIF
jgi:hypothetical protein